MEAVKERTLSSQLVMPFVKSTRTVLSTMAGITTKIGQPYLKNDGALKHHVSGIIGFMGEIEGSVVIGLDLSVATFIVKSFAGMELSPESPDFADAIGELANMIAGSAKQNLGAVASISLPQSSSEPAIRLRVSPVSRVSLFLVLHPPATLPSKSISSGPRLRNETKVGSFTREMS